MKKPDETNPYRKARLAAGYTSIEKVLYALARRLPDDAIPSAAKLARLESGGSADPEPLLVIFLANLYGCGVGELDEAAAAWLDTVKEQVEQSSPCITARQEERLFSLN